MGKLTLVGACDVGVEVGKVAMVGIPAVGHDKVCSFRAALIAFSSLERPWGAPRLYLRS